MSNINIDQLADEISNMITQYGNEIIEGIDKSGKNIANKAVKVLKETSPKDKGDYAKGWQVTKDQEFAEEPHYTVHNKTHYQLTHLLENGHVTKNGGRTRKYPHIKRVEEQVIDEYEQSVEEVIRNAAR